MRLRYIMDARMCRVLVNRQSNEYYAPVRQVGVIVDSSQSANPLRAAIHEHGVPTRERSFHRSWSAAPEM